MLAFTKCFPALALGALFVLGNATDPVQARGGHGGGHHGSGHHGSTHHVSHNSTAHHAVAHHHAAANHHVAANHAVATNRYAGSHRYGWNGVGWHDGFYYWANLGGWHYGPRYYRWNWSSPYLFGVPVGGCEATTVNQGVPYPILVASPPTTADSTGTAVSQ